MTFEVIFSQAAADDLERLFDHILAREINSATGDLSIPARAIEAIQQACELLRHSPFSCRKVSESPFVRELIIHFGASGFVALFEIRDATKVIIGAVRHQRESDYYG